MLPELFWLAILSAFWPTLLVVDVLAFQAPKPLRTLTAFLAGGLLTTTIVGTALVLNLDGDVLGTRSSSSAGAGAYFAVALLAFAAAALVRRRPARQRRPRTSPSLMERAIGRGAGISFAAGVILNVVPGVFPIVALKDVAERDYSASTTFVVLAAFYAVMFAFVEIPIAAYAFAPQRTEDQVKRFNAWLRANTQRAAVWVLLAGGIYLCVRGTTQLL